MTMWYCLLIKNQILSKNIIVQKHYRVLQFDWLSCRIHYGHDHVSNRWRLDCLLNRLFRRRSKKTSKLCITSLCEGNSLVTGEFPAQRTSNTENVSIWWRHYLKGVKHLTPGKDDWHFQYTERCRYNAVNILQNPNKRHPIARPQGRDMGSLLWVRALIYILSHSV